MFKHIGLTSLLGLAALAVPAPAFAYMGAGAGLSAIGSVLSFLGGFLLMAVGLVWYPLKRMLKRKKGGDDRPEAKAEE
jgi:hypothetical protein